MILTALKNANLALAFFLELGVLAALGYWGFQSGQGIMGKIVLGIGAPVVFVIVWALFGAPTATWHLYGLWRVILQIIVFGSAVVALIAVGQRTLGITFALVYIFNYILLAVWGQ